MSQSYLYVFLIVVLIQQSFSFKLSPQVNANGRLNQNSKVSIDNIRYSQRDTALRAFSTTIIESLMQKVDPNLAKGEFFFFFLAGNGALAFGVQLLPKIFKQRLDIQNLKGGVTLGGEDLGFNIFAALSYPESLKVKDIQNIISKIPSTKILQDKGDRNIYYFGMNSSFICLELLFLHISCGRNVANSGYSFTTFYNCIMVPFNVDHGMFFHRS